MPGTSASSGLCQASLPSRPLSQTPEAEEPGKCYFTSPRLASALTPAYSRAFSAVLCLAPGMDLAPTCQGSTSAAELQSQRRSAVVLLGTRRAAVFPPSLQPTPRSPRAHSGRCQAALGDPAWLGWLWDGLLSHSTQQSGPGLLHPLGPALQVPGVKRSPDPGAEILILKQKYQEGRT